MSKFYYSLFFICAVLMLTSLQTTATVTAQGDQDGKPAANSTLNSVRLPAGAVRVNEQSVPAEIRDTLGKLVAFGGERVRQGETEVLVWTSSGFRKSNALQTVKKLAADLQTIGWTYEIAEQNAEFTVFNSVNAVERRAITGFWTANDEFLMLAWTEMLPAVIPNTNATQNSKRAANNPAIVSKKDDGSAKVITAEKNALWVNVMGNEMPDLPQFPALAPKPGKVRGYVKDWLGKPLAGAAIGIRSSYFAGQYSGGQGTTDANGYYEFVVPKGSAHFYNAGYQIEWGDGIAAVSLHPADGKLDSFTTADGAVENFVLLPYGITSRENLQNNPRVSSTYYGGSIYVHYYAAEAGDSGAMSGSIVENSILEITLTPEDAGNTKSFVIRQPVGFAGNVTINNIPLGRYKISAKAGGITLKIKESRKFNPLFGLSPSETTGAASILFVPNQAKASMIGPANGAWDSISLDVLMP
jgi:hypothetical protein